MKKVYWILFFAIWSIKLDTMAQGKYSNYWAFSQHLGLNFNSGILPTADTSKIFGPLMSTASICDSNGQLECYVGTWKWADFDIRLFNRFHEVLEFGDKLSEVNQGQYVQYSGNTLFLNFSSSTDTVLLVQLAGNHLLNCHSLYYSLINNRARQDSGSIFSLNNHVLDLNAQQGIAAVRHANGRDWWILISGFPGRKIFKFIATPWEVNFYGYQEIGSYRGVIDTSTSGIEGFGELSVSLAGDMLVISNMGGLIEAFNFDRCSGTFYNPTTLQSISIPNNTIITTETANISPSGRFVYGLTFRYQPSGPGSGNQGQMVQYDLLSANPSADTSLVYAFRDIDSHIDQMEYGPDGRLWFTGRSSHNPALLGNLQYPQDSFMHFIEFPDVKGLACNVKINQVYMKGRRALAGLPNMPNYNLGPIDGSICDTLGLDVGVQAVQSKSIALPRIYPNPSFGTGAILSIPLGENRHHVYIYDTTGKLVWEMQTDSDTVQLPGFLPSGLYQVVVGGMVGVRWRVE